MEIFGYLQTENVTVDQNNSEGLTGMISKMRHSVAHPPSRATVPGDKMEMDNVMEQSSKENLQGVRQEFVGVEITLHANLNINV